MAFLLATSGADGQIILWNFSVGQPHKILTPHVLANKDVAKVNCIDFSKDGKLLASGGDDMKVVVTDLETNSVLKTFLGHRAAVSSCLFNTVNNNVISADPAELRIWALDKTPECIKTQVCFFFFFWFASSFFQLFSFFTPIGNCWK
jgi:WD40 repeat protein